jgi:hypothetical protein
MGVTIPGPSGEVKESYEISNSLRFNDDDNAYLSKTLSASPTNQKILSFSFWAKRGNLGLYSYNLVGNTSAPYVIIGFINDDTFSFQLNAGSGSTGLITTAKFRDTSAWFHTLCVLDTTQGTASNRMKMYINGVQITDFGTANYPAQDSTWNINTNVEHSVGGSSAVQDFDGYMTECHFIDGTAKAPTDFGEFDEDSGIWKPKRYTGAYGTNGFFLQFKQTGTSQNSSGIGADTSGNDNHFAVTNLAATDVTEDTCTNNFATFNALFKRTSVNPTFSEGNLKIVQGASNGIAYSTQGVSSGKWYVEIKVDNVGTGTRCGILEPSAYDNGNPDTQALYYQNNGNKNNKGSASGYGDSYTTGDIIGIAFDADNGTLAFYKNGVSQGTAFTGLDTNTTWLIGCHGYINSGSSGQSGNYGNPPFAISSGNTDGKYGNFEYAVPSGYYALCTKRLAEFG